MEAVQQNGLALFFASVELQNDKEMVKAVVKQASEQLKGTENVDLIKYNKIDLITNTVDDLITNTVDRK